MHDLARHRTLPMDGHPVLHGAWGRLAAPISPWMRTRAARFAGDPPPQQESETHRSPVSTNTQSPSTSQARSSAVVVMFTQAAPSIVTDASTVSTGAAAPSAALGLAAVSPHATIDVTMERMLQVATKRRQGRIWILPRAVRRRAECTRRARARTHANEEGTRFGSPYIASSPSRLARNATVGRAVSTPEARLARPRTRDRWARRGSAGARGSPASASRR